ncbi:MAG: hypothetical protein B7Z13_07145 [Caulobacterales bacterium 32-67-6]|nr:MAG: hypothetical protein B7Z13_07145 [Caulobacterales bacterium 32-67-6]
MPRLRNGSLHEPRRGRRILRGSGGSASGGDSGGAKLDRHPRFGPILQQWESRRAIPVKAKAAAVAGLSASWGLIVLTSQTAIIPAATAIIMGSVGVYVVSRPT